jgi:uncharacterized small protein (TIGR04563 family)
MMAVRFGFPDQTVRPEQFMSKTDKRKQSVYFPVDMLEEIQREALRQDRTVSWIMQRAWRISRDEVMKYPSINDPSSASSEDESESELN